MTMRLRIAARAAIRSLALAATLLSGAAHACSIFDEPGTCANPLSPQTAYQGIELSDGKEEVQYKLGAPEMVQEPEDPNSEWHDFWRVYTVAAPNSDTANALPHGRHFSSFDSWSYNLPSGDVTIRFDPETHKVIRVTCFTSTSCSAIGAISIGAGELAVKRAWGAPTSEDLRNGTKTLTYEALNIRLVLAKQKVYMIEVGRFPQ